jgi:hypothetical protein
MFAFNSYLSCSRTDEQEASVGVHEGQEGETKPIPYMSNGTTKRGRVAGPDRDWPGQSQEGVVDNILPGIVDSCPSALCRGWIMPCGRHRLTPRSSVGLGVVEDAPPAEGGDGSSDIGPSACSEGDASGPAVGWP